MRPLKSSTHRKWFSFNEVNDGLFNELVKLDCTVYTVILLVRPSGAKNMPRIANMVRSCGLSCGRDPLEEDVEVSLQKVNGGIK